MEKSWRTNNHVTIYGIFEIPRFIRYAFVLRFIPNSEILISPPSQYHGLVSLAAPGCCITKGAFEPMYNVMQAHDLVSTIEYAYISHYPSKHHRACAYLLQPADAPLDDPSRLLQELFGWDLCGSANCPLLFLINRSLCSKGDV